MPSLVLVEPLLFGVVLSIFIVYKASGNVPKRAALAAFILAGIFVLVYVPIAAKPVFTNATIASATDISNFIDLNSYPNLFLTDAILSIAVFDFVYTLSGTRLSKKKRSSLARLKMVLHICVAIGVVWLFWPLIAKIMYNFTHIQL